MQQLLEKFTEVGTFRARPFRESRGPNIAPKLPFIVKHASDGDNECFSGDEKAKSGDCQNQKLR